jgi:dTDP-4-dehydrorhamnose reductase
MKVLVAGSHGMLGKDLMEVFAAADASEGLDLPDLDITRLDQCQQKAAYLRPDVIINAAAYTQVDLCESNEYTAFAVNGHGAGNLAKAAASVGALLVHYSTDYIFDGLKQGPYVEDDTPNPQNIYGKSKALGEALVREHCPNHLILRTSWLFGRHGTNFIRTIVNAAAKGAPLRVVHDQTGSPSYARDVAVHTRRMVEAGCRSTYHLTNTGTCTWYELASAALEWAGLGAVPITPVPASEFPRPARRPANSVLANSRLENDGLPLMRPWQDAAREYVEYHLKLNA